MGYGSLGDMEELPAYLEDILGRAPSEALLRDAAQRYRLIGGRSPLLGALREHAQALERETGCKVHVGMLHSEPRIRCALETVLRRGHDAVLPLPACPFRGPYEGKAEAPGLRRLEAPDWHAHPLLVQAFRENLREPGDVVLFTAHGLPRREPLYESDFQDLASAVAGAAGVREWRLAYQGSGMVQALEEAAREGAGSVTLCPLGYLCECLETLYDCDILYKGIAERLGLRFERTPPPDPVPCWADVVRKGLAP